MGIVLPAVWLVAGAIIAHDLVIRWLTVQNRKLALIDARKQRDAARSAEAAKAGASGEGVAQ